VDLFSLEPWEFITVADIVERPGMTPATFYHAATWGPQEATQRDSRPWRNL
jgi:hypothetical protein